MQFGYARVSTREQNLSMQISALEAAGCRRIFQEKVSGARRDRPELALLLGQLREADAVVVCKLDRLARSTRDLLDIADVISRAGAGFRSLSEPWADTTTPAGRMVLTIFAGIAEFERALIRERTNEGRIEAMRRGTKFGPPEKLKADQVALCRRLVDEGMPTRAIAKMFGVNRSTIFRTLRRKPHGSDSEPSSGSA